MLPDLPSLKRDIKKVLDAYLQKQMNLRTGFIAELPKHVFHEGSRMRVVQADGSVDESDLKQVSAEMSLNLKDVPQLTLQQRISKLNEIAEQMASQISKHMFGTLNEVLGKAGQAVNHHGKPLDAEAIFSALESIQMDFDESGKHHELIMVMPPALASKAVKVFEQIDSDPVLRKRHEEIMTRKRMEWRDREASRKLVG
jgi:hypothetical protein